MFVWFRQNIAWLSSLSITLLALVSAAAVIVVVRMPADYFLRDPAGQPAPAHPLVKISLRILKNLLGFILILCGLVMAIPLVPGPGLAFLFVGLSLTEFPGKKSLEIRILRLGMMLHPIDWLRARFRRPPLQFPPRKDTRSSTDHF